jgi:peptide chain release factor 3
VIQHRLENEYTAKVGYEPVNLYKAFWVTYEDKEAYKVFETRRKRDLARDTSGNLVFLAESPWMLKMAQDNHPEMEFHETSEQ